MTIADHALPGTRTLLRAATQRDHEALDQGLMLLRPFDDLPRYTALLRAHHALFARCSPIYHDPALGALIPGLARRDRMGLAVMDLRDLGLEPDPHPPVPVAGIAAGLGWLYVLEGSKLGGTVLATRAARLGLSDRHGARHLAPAAEGSAPHWRGFTQALDAIPMDGPARRSAIDGATAAFRLAADLIRQAFAARG